MTAADRDGLASLDPTTQSIAHNLRTPLTVVIGYLDLLAEGQFGQITGEQAQVIGVMRQESERLRLTIDRLIALREVEALCEGSGRLTWKNDEGRRTNDESCLLVHHGTDQ